MVANQSQEIEDLEVARASLQDELEAARTDAQSAIHAHEALLEQLRKEHEDAETQLQTLMTQA